MTPLLVDALVAVGGVLAWLLLSIVAGLAIGRALRTLDHADPPIGARRPVGQ